MVNTKENHFLILHFKKNWYLPISYFQQNNYD